MNSNAGHKFCENILRDFRVLGTIGDHLKRHVMKFTLAGLFSAIEGCPLGVRR